MLETRAKVIQIKANSAIVLVNQISGCEQCKGLGCGSSKLGQLFCRVQQQFLVENPIQAQVGDEVILNVGEAVLLRSIGLLYLLPITLLMLGAALPVLFGVHSDHAAALGAVSGLSLGFLCVKYISAKLAQQSQPYIARRYVED